MRNICLLAWKPCKSELENCRGSSSSSCYCNANDGFLFGIGWCGADDGARNDVSSKKAGFIRQK